MIKKIGTFVIVGLLAGATIGALAVSPGTVDNDEIAKFERKAEPLIRAAGSRAVSETDASLEAYPSMQAKFAAIGFATEIEFGDSTIATPLAPLKESSQPDQPATSFSPGTQRDVPKDNSAAALKPFQMAQAGAKALVTLPPLAGGTIVVGEGQPITLADLDAPPRIREWNLSNNDPDAAECDPAGDPPGWVWDGFAGANCIPLLTDDTVDTVTLRIWEQGTYTLILQPPPDAEDPLPPFETIQIIVTEAPDDPPSASLSFAHMLPDDGSLLPLNDWTTLFQITMEADLDEDTGVFAERVLGQVVYSIDSGCFPENPPFDAFVSPTMNSILEFALVQDFGEGGPDGVYNPGPNGVIDSPPILTWANDGFPYQEPTDDLTFNLDFYENGYLLADPELRAAWPRSSTADGGNAYFVLFRTSAAWANATSLFYSAQLTERTMVDPNLFNPLTGETPVPLTDDGELLDGDPPDPYPGDGDCTRMYSSFSVYDATGAGPNPNPWTWVNKLYTPAAEHIRPRFDGASQTFDMVTGEWLDLRQLFALETWTSVIGINMHGNGGIREVNLVFTDIGADPNNPVPGNGGFDPRDGFDPFTIADEHPDYVPADQTLGREYPFNGAWMFHDTNDNSIFDVPVATTDSGVNFQGDYPMDPDISIPSEQVEPYNPGWEYIPNPPWGGDPAFKVRLRFDGGRRRSNSDDEPTGHLDPTPDSRDNEDPSSWAVDYFITIRPDSGFRDATLVAGDGTGLGLGADFRAFIEPRRFNPFLNEGEWDGGIWTDAQIFSPDSIVLDPLTVVNPPQAHFANNWPGPEGLHYHSLMDQPPPIGLNQPVDTLGANEKWWPQRFLNQNNAKPQRGAVEVHDLVLTYSTNNQDAKALLGVGYYASFSADDTLGLPGQLSLFDFWIDPFGQWGGDSAAVSFDNWTGFPTVFSGIHFVGTNAKDVILTTINIGDEIAIVSDDIFAYNQQSYETVPFFIPIFDEAPFGPRSQFFPNPPLRPSLPSYDSWPRKDLIENALPPGQYPRKSDWAQVDRAARLLQQHANNDDPPTAMIGINMVGADDPVVNRISQSFFEEVTVAFWGPDFTPSDLRPLDPNGANVESGVMLYEDSNSGSGLTGGIFNGTANSNFNAVLGADSPVPLNNLEWAGAPEPIDLDGDLIPDDMDGDGDADEDDYAWVLRMRPKDLWRVPISDIRYGGGLGTGDGGKSRAVVEEVAVAVSPMDIPEGGFTEDGVDAMLDEARAEKAAKAATPKALPDGGNEGDDLFVVIRPSDSVRQFEKIRVVIPAKLPSRIPAEQDASIAFSPNVHMPADSLIRRSPDENPVQDWYGHDTLEFNVPTALVSLLAPNSEIGAGIPVAVIGVDASTNRPSSEATPYSSQTLGEGTRGDSTLVVSGLPWPVGALVGDFVIDSEFEPYEIVGNTANVVTLLSGSPREGAWLIARSPTFLEQMIVEIYDEGIDTDGDGFPDEPDGQFNMAEDLASLDFEDPANGVSSGVSIYRDNFFHPNNRRGVFDPPVVVNGAVQYIDLPVRLDDRPVRLGIPGEPTNQIRFVFSSPGTDNVPTPIADQPRLRQWIPDSFGGLQAGNEPDFFVVLRSSLDMVLGDDFRVGIVSWGPNTPTEPDPDTFSDPPPPAQPADEFDVFSEFAWGTRAIGYISFFKEPPLYYWMDEHTAHQEVDISGYNWVRTTVSKNLLTEVITGAQGLTPDFIAEPTRQGRDLPVQFTSLTDPALASAYLWDFGDGITSTDQNPSHSYTVAGLYTVSLTVTDLTGIKFTETKPDYIEILLQPFAEFIASLRDGEAALQVSFLDQSDGGPSGNPVSYLWDFGDGSPTSADPNPLHLYTMAGFYTVELTVTFADGSVDTVEKPQYITVRLGGGGGGGTVVGGPTASLTVADSIAAGDVDRSGHALVPLNDWVPLFNINMSSDDAEAPATRFLQTLTYSLVSDPDPDPGPTLLSSYPRMSDILEYGLFVEGGDPEEDFDGGLDSLDTLLFTWDNTGAPVGFGVDLGGSIQYNLSFIGTGSTNDPQYRVQSGFDENGLSYIVAMRTSATWRDGIDLGYEVLDARMTPFAVNEDGEPADSYSPNFLDAEILEDNPLYTSSFSVYDITAGPAEPYLEAYHNSWITPHTAQIPMVEFSRPRFNPAGTVFDIVAGHFQGMRQLFAVDTWVQAVGIDAHSTGLSHTDHPVYTTGEDPAIPQATLREVNVVFTDIGGDPFAGPGSGGFDPRSGLENFPDIFEDGSEFLEVETAIGRDPGFYGVAIFADTNNNGLFDPPTPAPDGFGVTFTDYHLLPEIIPPEWEYISFPPGGGDPWWKIKLQFRDGSRERLGSPLDGLGGFLEPVPDAREGADEEIQGGGNGLADAARVDYFLVFRPDGGFTDVSTEPGDGIGLTPGADTRVFVEPRRVNPTTGSNTGGIYIDSMIPYAENVDVVAPVWQDDPRWGEIEPWWPERTLNSTVVKPLRTGVEVHDLVSVYETRALTARFPTIPFALGAFPLWLDSLGLTASRFLNFDTPPVGYWEVSVSYNAFGVPLYTTNSRTDSSYPAFESVPFFLPEFDGGILGPRSRFYQNPLALPSMPDYLTWPAELAPGAYPHLTDWAPEDRQARLLVQRVDSRSGLMPILGFNLVGNGDPVVLASNPSTLDELTVAIWGPGFDPSDLLPLDPEGDDLDSGVTLWADDDINAGDGVFLSSPEANFGVAGFQFDETVVPLNLLGWKDAAEPVDIDGDGVADDVDGDGDVDSGDNAWVLTLTPQTPIVLPGNDQDNEGTADSPHTFGDDLFFVVKTSKDISAHEKFRAFVPFTLPSRDAGQRQAGMRITPQGTVSASALTKRNPEEGTVVDFYSHDMLNVNVPVDITNIASHNVQLRPNSPALPVFGIDAYTNRPELTVDSGTEGVGAPEQFLDTSKAWAADVYRGKYLVDSGYKTFAIVGNTADRLTLVSGEPHAGSYLVVKDPTFLEQIIVEFERASTASTFSFFVDLLPLAADQSVSGVALYRDNDGHPDNLNGVFDPGIDIPVVLDDSPVLVGGAGQPTAQVKFVMSSPGTDDFPVPIEEQPRLRQWVPNAQGGPGAVEFEGPDFFVVVRASAELGEGADFTAAIVSWGPNTPSEPDPDTFTFPLPPEQPADEFKKFSEFPFGSRGLGFITMYEEAPTRYWMRERVAYSEPDPSPLRWIRSTTSKKVQSGTITTQDALVTPTMIVIDSATPGGLPLAIPEGETIEVLLRGDNFGSAAQVAIGGYSVEVLESSDYVIRLALSDLPNVEPQTPVVTIVRNPFTLEEATRADLFTLIEASQGTRVLDVVPSRGSSVDFSVTVIGENFSQPPLIEVIFGEMVMPVISVSEDGTSISVGFPPGGMPDTGALDVQVKNYSKVGVLASQDTLLSGFTFLNDPALMGPCFIATAAFGSPLEARLDTFRAFRDGVLLQSAAGVALVDAYYTASPALADEVAARPWLASVVRMVLIPAAWFLEFPIALTFALLAVAGASLGRRRWRAARN